MQQTVIILGISLVVIGLSWPFIKKLPFGQFPGDLIFQSGNLFFYVPIVTCIFMSVVLTALFNFFR